MDADEAEYRANHAELLRAGHIPPLHEHMGIETVRLNPTTVLTMPLSDEVRGFASGSVHGGMLATFADIASAIALWSSFDRHTQIPITTDLHMRYFRQPTRGPLTAEASVVYRGSRLLSTECAVTDADDRLLARANATYMLATRPQA